MSESLDRFALAERLVHWLVAILMGSCLVTAAILYNGSLMLAIGHRHLVELVHVWAVSFSPSRCWSAPRRRRTGPTYDD